MAVSVFLWCEAVFFLKDAVEIAQVAVAYRLTHFIHAQGGMFQIIGRLGQSFFLKQFFIGSACPAFDFPTEPAEVIVERIRFCAMK